MREVVGSSPTATTINSTYVLFPPDAVFLVSVLVLPAFLGFEHSLL